ncbi:alpha/beta fold hydrolase [Pseudomonas sp. SH1-B]
MEFTQYGCSAGHPVIYFHGVPGSPLESAIFDAPARMQGLRILSFDRFAIAPSLGGADYYQHIAHLIDKTLQGAPADFIGFSLGAHAALEVSALMPGQVRCLHLISAAAPLDAGNFLDGMAGKAVFSLATLNPTLFHWLARWQALLARRAPRLLFGALFASACSGDRALVKDPAFRALICRVLRNGFAHGTAGYMRDIHHYLQPWSTEVFDGAASVCLWHGTQDNWSPFAMSTYLAERMAQKARLERMNGLSHYSCLYAAAPRICARLANA